MIVMKFERVCSRMSGNVELGLSECDEWEWMTEMDVRRMLGKKINNTGSYGICAAFVAIK